MYYIYTDGSRIPNPDTKEIGLGAAYISTHRDAPPRTMYVSQTDGGPRDINQAELSAILMALKDPIHCKKDIIIYTDSLCSTQLINKMLRTPHLLHLKPHAAQLTSQTSPETEYIATSIHGFTRSRHTHASIQRHGRRSS